MKAAVEYQHSRIGRLDDVREHFALGQSLSHAMFEVFVEFPQLSLGGLSCRDVNGGADDADALITPEDASALRRHPANDPILLADRSILDIVKCAADGVRSGGEGGGSMCTIFGMKPRIEIHHRHGHLRGNTEHGFDPGGPIQRIRYHIHVPKTDLCSLGRQTQLLFAFRQSPCRSSLFRYVNTAADVADNLTRDEARHPTRIQHARLAVEAPAPI